MLVRFTTSCNISRDALTGDFASVIAAYEYRGGYTAVHPTGVKPAAVRVGLLQPRRRRACGLEAGSKPELAAVLGLAPDGCPIVCNGYKDRAYVRRALIGQKLGHQVYIVVEKPGERTCAGRRIWRSNR